MKKLIINQRITTRESEAFKMYLNEVAKIPLLSDEEEKAIAIRANDGDEEAVHLLVKHNLRFVVSVAKQYESPVAPLEDLVNEGNIGLQIAAQRFDPERNFKFISYAVWWVRRKILDYTTNKSRLIHVPGNKVGNINKIKRAMSRLEQHYEREPSMEELAEFLNDKAKIDAKIKAEKEGTEFDENEEVIKFTVEQLEFLLNIDSTKVDSLDSPMDEEGFTRKDVIPNKSSKPADYLTSKDDKSTNVEVLLSNLKPRHREVMEHLYGLTGNEPLTLKETGLEMGISRERVRQLRDAAKRVLKVKAEEYGWHYMVENL